MKPLRYFLIIVLIASLASCLKAPNEIKCIGDAMIVSKMDGNKVVYGISLYAYTNSAFQNVQVVSSADPTKSYTLKADQGVKTNFVYDMPENEYSATKPAPSTYTFTATLSNGTTQVFTDDLTDKILPIPAFSKCAYNSQLIQIDVAWPAIDSASSYAINVFNGTTPVFWSNELAGTTKSYTVIAGTNSWAAGFNPEYGKTYSVRLYAYLYEEQGNNNNVQAISYIDQNVVWGK